MIGRCGNTSWAGDTPDRAVAACSSINSKFVTAGLGDNADVVCPLNGRAVKEVPRERGSSHAGRKDLIGILNLHHKINQTIAVDILGMGQILITLTRNLHRESR
jgi:hypothetical protein